MVGWNGIELTVPKTWEAIVSGPCHLLFEFDFAPLFELRWERVGKLSSSRFEARVRQIRHQAQKGGRPLARSINKDDLAANFDFTRLFGDDRGELSEGICYCSQSTILLVFQVLTHQHRLRTMVKSVLKSLKCRPGSEVLWRVQDFSLKLPPSFHLQDFSFLAGFTSLKFNGPDYSLMAGKLAGAGKRLEHQSLAALLPVLAGTDHIRLQQKEHSCTGYRKPGWGKRMFYRLKREPPFLTAKIWRTTGSDHLLAIILSSTSNICDTSLDSHSQRYEII
ncbi:hypothetical protein SAMN05660330_00999 [Desulforhopalus singaporensis]|uniref:Uncharacterized protein n=2 Tax=Desulforhopalus singaporensis TaxID=91360 RepID=A0A1H0M651_9BACT|nr:hypothetical protein SAMN05660330_00999 [Desulforhopalus singaporensis]